MTSMSIRFDSSLQWPDCFSALAAIQDGAWLAALQQARLVQLPAGVRIFGEGDSCQNYLLVLDGVVRVQKLSASGREILLYRVRGGESCVLTTTSLLADRTYKAEAYTETQVKALALPAAAFSRALEGSPSFRRFALESYGERLADLLMLIDAIAFGRLDARLAQRLLDLADADGRLEVKHQDLARELGTAREVVSRSLKEFEHAGWVNLKRGRIEILQRRALMDLLKRSAA